nr:hypothetical protein [Tanacetum cinerariifolium]
MELALEHSQQGTSNEVSVLPSLVWPKLLTADTNYVELVDARVIVHMVKMDSDYEDSAWSFYGSGWVSFISTFKDLNPKIIHFEQIDLKTFLVNFYSKDGDEIDYVFTKGHEMKCVVVGCRDPWMYQPIPHKILLNSKVNLDRKRVAIAFNGVEVELKRLCIITKFSAAKAILISCDESGGLFVGKVINGVVADTETNLDTATGETSNVVPGSEKTFISVFISCIDTKGYMSILVTFHCHRMHGGYHGVWINARGRSLYMSIKIHIDERSKSLKNTNVQLVGEMHQLKELLELNVGDRILFELVFGNISSDEPMLFNASKVV